MNVYADSSVPLRILLGEDDPLPLTTIEAGFTSALFSVEARRTLDRLRVTQSYNDADVAAAMSEVLRIERALVLLDVSNEILDRAASPFPTTIGTLDAIHVATALTLRNEVIPDLVFATHDRQQAIAARVLGFEVVGVEL